jgi:hypothetical protein
MSSDKSLSSALLSPELPGLPSSFHTPSSISVSSTTSLYKSKVYIFTQGLFKHTELDMNLSSVQYICTQPKCQY